MSRTDVWGGITAIMTLEAAGPRFKISPDVNVSIFALRFLNVLCHLSFESYHYTISLHPPLKFSTILYRSCRVCKSVVHTQQTFINVMLCSEIHLPRHKAGLVHVNRIRLTE